MPSERENKLKPRNASFRKLKRLQDQCSAAKMETCHLKKINNELNVVLKLH